MGSCSSCNAQDLDEEVRYIDTRYTPSSTILEGSSKPNSTKSRESSTLVEPPIARRKHKKKASIVHATHLEYFAPLVSSLASLPSFDSDPLPPMSPIQTTSFGEQTQSVLNWNVEDVYLWWRIALPRGAQRYIELVRECQLTGADLILVDAEMLSPFGMNNTLIHQVLRQIEHLKIIAMNNEEDGSQYGVGTKSRSKSKERRADPPRDSRTFKSEQRDREQPTFPIEESKLESEKPTSKDAGAGVICEQDVTKCPNGHIMQMIPAKVLPTEYLTANCTPQCDSCGRPDIHLRREYFHCFVCEHDRCKRCEGKTKTAEDHISELLSLFSNQSTSFTLSKSVKSREAGKEGTQMLLSQGQLKIFLQELSKTKKRMKRHQKKLKKDQDLLLKQFEEREHLYLTSTRQKAFVFLARAFEVGLKIEESLLADLYAYYSQNTGDINESQMLRMLTECNKAFMRICEVSIQGARKSLKQSDFVLQAYLEEAEENRDLFKHMDLTNKDARLARARFHPDRDDAVISLRAFIEHIGTALFPDQIRKMDHWYKLLQCENHEDFIDVINEIEMM